MPGETKEAPPNGQGGGLLDGGSATEGSTSGESKDQNTTADEYSSVKLPEGVDVDAEFFGDVKSWAKENTLKPEALQKLVEKWAERTKTVSAKAEEEYKTQQKTRVDGWLKELQSDKEFGQTNFKTNVANLQKFLNKIDPEKSFRQELVRAGIDSWPPLVRFLHKMATSSKDDSVMGTLEGASVTPATDDAAFHRALYPSMFKGS